MGALLDVIIPGSPQGYQRPGVRVVRTREGKTFAQHYEQAATRSWRSVAVGVLTTSEGAPRARVESDPVRVIVEAVAPRPASVVKRLGCGRLWRTSKPDVDNVCKSVLDSLTTSGVLRDDVLVAELVARSIVAADGEAAHVRVVVEILEPLPLIPWPEKLRAKAAPRSSLPLL